MKKKILIAEDNAAIRQMLNFLLTREGYEVEMAIHGKDALEKATLKQPDLILMDVMMFGVDGYQVCRTLKSDAKTSQIPVVLVSARGQKSEQEEGLAAGASAYIVKPFDPENLMGVVAGILKSPKQ